MTTTGAALPGPALHIDVFTIFPDIVRHYCSASILARAQRDKLLELAVYDLREGASDGRRTVDDAPFGGGAGMVLGPAPIFALVERVAPMRPLIYLSPSGERFDQNMAAELARLPGGFSLLCGRYEGVDQRVIDHLVDREISIGDVVLAGGELPALVVIEAVARLVPGVLGNDLSIQEESFGAGLLEYPHYTRPAQFRDWSVPPVLLSGDHGAVRSWRKAASLAITMTKRPDLLEARGGLGEEEIELLANHGYRGLFGPADLTGAPSPQEAASAIAEERTHYESDRSRRS